MYGVCPRSTFFICSTCGGSEGDLPTDCPGEPMPYDVSRRVYAERLNFIHPFGWVVPTDRQWKANC